MARFANLKNRTPAPRIKVKAIETGRNALGSYSIYQDDRGRQATLTPGMEDENGTIPLHYFVSALKGGSSNV